MFVVKSISEIIYELAWYIAVITNDLGVPMRRNSTTKP